MHETKCMSFASSEMQLFLASSVSQGKHLAYSNIDAKRVIEQQRRCYMRRFGHPGWYVVPILFVLLTGGGGSVHAGPYFLSASADNNTSGEDIHSTSTNN